MKQWKWSHVTLKCPCPICEKPDWCSICGDLNLVLCMRVTSARPSRNAMGGWLHPLDAERKRYIPESRPEPAFTIDAGKMMQEFSADTTFAGLSSLAKELGVTVESLQLLGCQRAVRHRSWAFPMYNGGGQVVGIRLRGDDGSKFAVKGSHGGIFLPMTKPQRTAYIVEGASDAAAILSLGLYGFGRPQASGCIATIAATIGRLNIQEVVIISDNDCRDKNGVEAGLRGAKALSDELDIPNCVLIPQTKDLRQFLNFGGTAELLRAMLADVVWFNRKR